MRIFFFLLFVFFFSGCSSKKEFVYWDKFEIKKYKKIDESIGIKLQIPEYLWAGNFVAIKNHKLILLKYKINSIPEDFFEKILIQCLKVSFGDNNIKSYPWSFYKKPKKIVLIKIIDYYVDLDNNEVVLKFSVFNKNYITKRKFTKNYYKTLKIVYNNFINKVANILNKGVK